MERESGVSVDHTALNSGHGDTKQPVEREFGVSVDHTALNSGHGDTERPVERESGVSVDHTVLNSERGDTKRPVERESGVSVNGVERFTARALGGFVGDPYAHEQGRPAPHPSQSELHPKPSNLRKTCSNSAVKGANFAALSPLPSMSLFAEILADYPETPKRSVVNDAIQQTLASQHAVISRRQLNAFGLTADAIRRRVANHELFAVDVGAGVYTGQARPISPEGRRRAGLLWAPEGTWLAGASATATLGLERGRDAVVELLTLQANERRRPAPGVRLYRAKSLDPRDLTIVDDVPCTQTARAMFDVAHASTADRLDRLVEQAEALRIYDHASMHRVLEASSRRRGAPAFAAALGRVDAASDLARSVFESKTAELLRSSPHLPEIALNARLFGVESDLWLVRSGAVIECDGRRFHRTPERILRDAERDRVLKANGLAVLRLLWEQVVYEPERTLARVVAFYRANAAMPRHLTFDGLRG